MARRGRGLRWFLAAVALHIVLDLAAFALPILLPLVGMLVAEAVVGAMTLGSGALVVREGQRAGWW